MTIKGLTLVVLLLSLVSLTKAQAPREVKILEKIRLHDGKFHELEIKANGVYVDGTLKVAASFDEVWPLSDTTDYWDYPQDLYTVSSMGHYFLFGTHVVNGVCGTTNYAMVYVDTFGAIKLSDQSPGACMGDNPSEIRFSIHYWKGECHPIWTLSNSLEFDGYTFRWKDLTKKRTAKRKTSRK